MPAEFGSEPFSIVVADHEGGERLDKVLSARGLGFSRATLQRWIERGRVTVDGSEANSRLRVKSGAQIHVAPEPPPPTRAEPENIALDVVYEDDEVLVIHKPAGLVVHPGPGHSGGTLVNALVYRGAVAAHAPLRGHEHPRPGIVHRLDKDTSGLLVVAKTPAARDALVPQFKAHSIERRYLGIVLGHPGETMTIDTLHGRHPTDRKRFTSRVTTGKRALTHIRVLERLHGASLVEARLETGRTHQIRVHMAEHGHPILGDRVYGRTIRDPKLRAAAATLGHQALHAAHLAFDHPTTGKRLAFDAAPSARFVDAIRQLRA